MHDTLSTFSDIFITLLNNIFGAFKINSISLSFYVISVKYFRLIFFNHGIILNEFLDQKNVFDIVRKSLNFSILHVFYK